MDIVRKIYPKVKGGGIIASVMGGEVGKNVLKNFITIGAIDGVWMFFMLPSYKKLAEKIQHSKSEPKLKYAIPVYIALAYFLEKASSVKEAFLFGIFIRKFALL